MIIFKESIISTNWSWTGVSIVSVICDSVISGNQHPSGLKMRNLITKVVQNFCRGSIENLWTGVLSVVDSTVWDVITVVDVNISPIWSNAWIS